MLLRGVTASCCYDCQTCLNTMSEEQLKAFIAKARVDVSLQERLKGAKSPYDVVVIAKNMAMNLQLTTLVNSTKRS